MSEVARSPRRLTPLVADTTTKLSEREMEVLRYLPTMLTAGEIAAELYVSVNTIKAHTRSIYRKMGASRRHEAVVQAYERGILSYYGPPSYVPIATGRRAEPR